MIVTPAIASALAEVLQVVDGEYSLSYAEWVILLRSIASDIENDLSEGERKHLAQLRKELRVW